MLLHQIPALLGAHSFPHGAAKDFFCIEDLGKLGKSSVAKLQVHASLATTAKSVVQAHPGQAALNHSCSIVLLASAVWLTVKRLS